MSRNTNTAGLPPADDADQPIKPRRLGVLVIGFFTMRAPRPKPPRLYRRRQHRPVQLDLFPSNT